MAYGACCLRVPNFGPEWGFKSDPLSPDRNIGRFLHKCKSRVAPSRIAKLYQFCAGKSRQTQTDVAAVAIAVDPESPPSEDGTSSDLTGSRYFLGSLQPGTSSLVSVVALPHS